MKNKILEYIKNLLVGIIFFTLIALLGVFIFNTMLGAVTLLIILLSVPCYVIGGLIRMSIKDYKKKQE